MDKSYKNRFVIAYNLLDPTESQILTRNLNQQQAEDFARRTATDFLGRGFALYYCKTIRSLASANDLAFELSLDNHPTAFEVVTILEMVPFIEGTPAAGPYQFYPQSLMFYEIKDLATLNLFWNNDANFDFENEKIVCQENGIYKLHEQALSGAGNNRFVVRLPLTYFDLYCPVCHKLITTYQADQESLLCEIDETSSCVHNVGSVLCSVSHGRIDEVIEGPDHPFELRDGRLFFDVGQDEWQEAIIHTVDGSLKQSYWESDDDLDYNSLLVFLPQPKSQAKAK